MESINRPVVPWRKRGIGGERLTQAITHARVSLQASRALLDDIGVEANAPRLE